MMEIPQLDLRTRDLLRHLRANNVRVCSILGSLHGENSYVPFSRQSVRNLCARLGQESIAGDMAKTLNHFSAMQKRTLLL
jgi:hypothetical protein